MMMIKSSMSLVDGSLDAVPEFDLHRPGWLSDLTRERGASTFRAAAAYARDLPYRRPGVAGDEAAVLIEGCGTCSSKHTLLAAIAREHPRDRRC
jgi:hypothetical protein